MNAAHRGWMAFAAAWLACMGVAVAQEPTQESVQEPMQDAAPAAPIRDPFWPVGYAPPTPEEQRAAREAALAAAAAAAAAAEEAKAAAVAEARKPRLDWPNIPVRGRLRAPDGSYRIIIDGQGVVGKDDVVTVRAGARWFQWRVARVDANGFEVVRLGATTTPPPAKPILFERVLIPPESPKENTP
jgi:hypothetical protein